jgi:hypothetical protein
MRLFLPSTCKETLKAGFTVNFAKAGIMTGTRSSIGPIISKVLMYRAVPRAEATLPTRVSLSRHSGILQFLDFRDCYRRAVCTVADGTINKQYLAFVYGL